MGIGEHPSNPNDGKFGGMGHLGVRGEVRLVVLVREFVTIGLGLQGSVQKHIQRKSRSRCNYNSRKRVIK